MISIHRHSKEEDRSHQTRSHGSEATDDTVSPGGGDDALRGAWLGDCGGGGRDGPVGCGGRFGGDNRGEDSAWGGGEGLTSGHGGSVAGIHGSRARDHSRGDGVGRADGSAGGAVGAGGDFGGARVDCGLYGGVDGLGAVDGGGDDGDGGHGADGGSEGDGGGGDGVGGWDGAGGGPVGAAGDGGRAAVDCGDGGGVDGGGGVESDGGG
jgi:hypothetical protein